MAELVNYELQTRPGGPEVGVDNDQDTQTRSSIHTPGVLAVIVRSGLGLICHDPSGEGLNVESAPPEAEPVIEITPMIAACKITRDVTDPDAYAQRSNDLWGFFGAGFRRTPEELLEGQRWYREQSVPMFGEQVNFEALDEIDLTGLPFICERFRQSYYSIFEDQAPFQPPLWDAIADGVWNMKVIDAIWAALEDPNSPIHRLEWWWYHALSVTAVPILEAHLS